MADKKEKYSLEFTIRSSVKILFNHLSTASGLESWFADKVNVRDGDFIFVWDGSEQRAKIASKKENVFIKFKWVGTDSDDDTFFQFEIVTDEITGDIALVVTDFALKTELEENKMLWESQIENLVHTLGG
ncbi:MAG: hypothetical protein RIQ89_1233 [Bacteroidota bacterium]|jgi:uncharacterized protein YndB with AHSA1/START domain